MFADYLMGPLKRYLTQSLANSLSTYISNINIETLGVGGDMILRDLELRLDVLQESLKIPLAFVFSRGFIKELRIQIHWTKLLSHPIHVKISTIEIILTARSELEFRKLQLKYHRHSSVSSVGSLLSDGDSGDGKSQTTGGPGDTQTATSDGGGNSGEGPSSFSPMNENSFEDDSQKGGWLKDALRKIVANATIEISDLVLKYEHANVVLSASFRSLSIFSADPQNGWKVKFQEPHGPYKSIFKACEVKDLTINLERTNWGEAAFTGGANAGSNVSTPKRQSGEYFQSPPKSFRRRTSLSSMDSFSSSSKRFSGARAKPVTVELPILRRACISCRGKISIDPFASRDNIYSNGGSSSGSNVVNSGSGKGGMAQQSPTNKRTEMNVDNKNTGSLSPMSLNRQSSVPPPSAIHRSTSSGQLFMQSAMQLIKRSTSDTFSISGDRSQSGLDAAMGNSTRESLKINHDPYKDTTCLLPLLCDVDTGSWRARRDDTVEMEQDELDWTIIAISDIHVKQFDVFVSEEQFVMLGKLMVLPNIDEEVEEEEEEEEVVKVDGLVNDHVVQPVEGFDGKKDDDFVLTLNAQPSELLQSDKTPHVQPENTIKATSQQQVMDGKDGVKDGSWGSWVWGVVVGESDELESKMILDAAETAREAERQRIEAINQARKRKRFLTVCGMRVDRVNVSFLVHRDHLPSSYETEESQQPATNPVDSSIPSTPVMSVPVANVGFVQVEMDNQNMSSPHQSLNRKSKSPLLELARIQIEGIMLEARGVDDLSLDKSHAFVELFMDVGMVKFARHEERPLDKYHDLILWGSVTHENNLSMHTLMDTMPHPLPCWSFFHEKNILGEYSVHFDKECCLGTSLYRRNDKAFRMRCFSPLTRLPPTFGDVEEHSHNDDDEEVDETNQAMNSATVQPIELDVTCGVVTCKIEPQFIASLAQFFGIGKTKLTSSPSLPSLQEGSAGAALKELALEYRSIIKQRKPVQTRPVDLLMTVPSIHVIIQGSSSSTSPSCCVGFKLSDSVVRAGVNLHRAHLIKEMEYYERFSNASRRRLSTASLSSTGSGGSSGSSQFLPNKKGGHGQHHQQQQYRNEFLKESMPNKVKSANADVGSFLFYTNEEVPENLRDVHKQEQVPEHANVIVRCQAFQTWAGLVKPRGTALNVMKTNAGAEFDTFEANVVPSNVLLALETVSRALVPLIAPNGETTIEHRDATTSTEERILNIFMQRMHIHGSLDAMDNLDCSMVLELGDGGVSIQHPCTGPKMTVLKFSQIEHGKKAFQFGVNGNGSPAVWLNTILANADFGEIIPVISKSSLGIFLQVSPLDLDLTAMRSVTNWASVLSADIRTIFWEHFHVSRESYEPLHTDGDDDDDDDDDDAKSATNPYKRDRLTTFLASNISYLQLLVDVNVAGGLIMLSSALHVGMPEILLHSIPGRPNMVEYSISDLCLLAMFHKLEGGRSSIHPIVDRFKLHGHVGLTLSPMENDPELHKLCCQFNGSLNASPVSIFVGHHSLNALTSTLQVLQGKSNRTKKAKKRTVTKHHTGIWLKWRVDSEANIPKVTVDIDTCERPYIAGLHGKSAFRAPDMIRFSLDDVRVASVVDQTATFDEHSFLLGNVSIFETNRNDLFAMSVWGGKQGNKLGILALAYNQTLGQVLSYLSPGEILTFATANGISVLSFRVVDMIIQIVRQLRYRFEWRAMRSPGGAQFVHTPILLCSRSNKANACMVKVIQSSGDQAIQAKVKPIDVIFRPAVMACLKDVAAIMTQNFPSSNKDFQHDELGVVAVPPTSVAPKQPQRLAGDAATVLEKKISMPHLDFAMGSFRVFFPVSTLIDPELPPMEPLQQGKRAFVFSIPKISCEAMETGGNELQVDSMTFSFVELALASAGVVGQPQQRQDQPRLGGALEEFFVHQYNLGIHRITESLLFSKHSVMVHAIPDEDDLGTINIKLTIPPLAFHLDETEISSMYQLNQEFGMLLDSSFRQFWVDPTLDIFEATNRAQFDQQVFKFIKRYHRTSFTRTPTVKNNRKTMRQETMDDSNKIGGDLEPSKSGRGCLMFNINSDIESIELIVIDRKRNDRCALKILTEHVSMVHSDAKATSSMTIEKFHFHLNGEPFIMDPLQLSVNCLFGDHAMTNVTIESMSRIHAKVSKDIVNGLVAFHNSCDLVVNLPDSITQVRENGAILSAALKISANSKREAEAFEERDASQRVQLGLKMVIPGIHMELGTTQLGPSVLVNTEQIFFQHLLRGKDRVEFDIVTVGMKIDRLDNVTRETSPILFPLDFRCFGVQHGKKLDRTSVTIEMSDAQVTLSNEHLAVLSAVGLSLTPKLKKTGKNRQPNHSKLMNIMTEQPCVMGRPRAMSSRGDFDFLKRIYDMGTSMEGHLYPSPGQIVFGAIGTPGELIRVDDLWTFTVETESFEDDGKRLSNVGGHAHRKRRAPSPDAVKNWVTLHWRYFEPRIVNSLDLIHALPIPWEVASVAIHPDSLSQNALDCQICYWDDIHRVFVVVSSFTVPLEKDLVPRKRAVDEFADAFSSLVDMSVNEEEPPRAMGTTDRENGDIFLTQRHKEEENERKQYGQFPISIEASNMKPSSTWMIRWRARPTGEHGHLDDRLAVCTALSRSLNVSSVCSSWFWYPLELRCMVQNLRLAILHPSQSDQGDTTINTTKDEELFILRATNFRTHVQQSTRDKRVRVGADLEVYVQDFGYLTITPFIHCHGLSMTLSSSMPALHQAIAIECRTWKWYMSRKTILPFHYGVHAFVADMEKVQSRIKAIMNDEHDYGTSSIPLVKEDGKNKGRLDEDQDVDQSLQYLIVNNCGSKIWFGQYGTTEVLKLDVDSTVPYSWKVSEAYLRPTVKDLALSGNEEEVWKRETAAQAFKPLMRFALQSAKKQDEPGTWSRPVHIDTLGVHNRAVVYSSVNKDISSVFFGNEPCSNLWISTQRGGNGLQTIVRLIPSHFVVNRLPRSLELDLYSTVKRLPSTSKEALKKVALESFLSTNTMTQDLDVSEGSGKTLERNKVEDSSKQSDGDHQDDYIYGFMDEQEFTYDYHGAGTIGLMCPDPSLLTSEANQAKEEVNIRVRKGSNDDWSEPIRVFDGSDERKAQLIHVPNLGCVWFHFGHASLRTRSGQRRRAWVVLEFWPTLYFFNRAPWPVVCRSRPQNRLEMLQYALISKESKHKPEGGLWPIVDGISSSAPSTSSKIQRHQSSVGDDDDDHENGQDLPLLEKARSIHGEDLEMLKVYLQEESIPIKQQNVAAKRRNSSSLDGNRGNLANDDDEEEDELETWYVPENSIHAVFSDPSHERIFFVSHQDKWSNPPLRIQADLFSAANTSGLSVGINRVGSKALAHRMLQFPDCEEQVVMEAHRVMGYPSVFMYLFTSVHVVNETDRTISLKGMFSGNFASSSSIAAVAPLETIDLPWKHDRLLGVCVSLMLDQTGKEQSVFSSMVSLNQPDEHIVAIPIRRRSTAEGEISSAQTNIDGWVAQFLCEVKFDQTQQSTTIVFRNRIIVHNETGIDLQLCADTPYSYAINEPLLPVGFPNRGSATPVSYFCENPLTTGGVKSKQKKQSPSPGANGNQPKSPVLKVRALSDFSDWILRKTNSISGGGLNEFSNSAESSSLATTSPGNSNWELNTGDAHPQQQLDHGGFDKVDLMDYRLLSTLVRLKTSTSRWSEPLVFPSFDLPESWSQLFLMETSRNHIECFICTGREIGGVIHVSVHREPQPDLILSNRLNIPLLYSFPYKAYKHNESTKSSTIKGWTTTLRGGGGEPHQDRKRGSFSLCIPPKACIALNISLLTKRTDDAPFEILFGSDSNAANAKTNEHEDMDDRFNMTQNKVDAEEEQDQDDKEMLDKIHSSLKRHGALRQHVSHSTIKGSDSQVERSVHVFEKQTTDSANQGNGDDGVPGGSTMGSLHGKFYVMDGSDFAEQREYVVFVPQKKEKQKHHEADKHKTASFQPRLLWRMTGDQQCVIGNGVVAKTSISHDFCSWNVEFRNYEDEDEDHSSLLSGDMVKSLKLMLYVHDLHVSLFDDFLETIHLRAHHVEASFLNSITTFAKKEQGIPFDNLNRSFVACRSRAMRIDSFVRESDIPVILYFLNDSLSKPRRDRDHESYIGDRGMEHPYDFPNAVHEEEDKCLLAVSWVENKNLPMQYQDIHIHFAPFAVAVEDALLKRLAESLTPIFVTIVAQQKQFVKQMMKKKRLDGTLIVHDVYQSEDDAALTATTLDDEWCSGKGFLHFPIPKGLTRKDARIFIKVLRVSNLHVISTIRTTTLPMFVGIDRTPLKFSPVFLTNVFENMVELRKELLANYIADAIIGSPALLGSLEILGNPVGFVRSVGTGVYDLLFLPLRAIRHGYGPGGILREVAHGWTSLLLHFSEGALMSVSGFSTSIARNLDRLSLDPAYAERREQLRRRRTQSSQGPPSLRTKLRGDLNRLQGSRRGNNPGGGGSYAKFENDDGIHGSSLYDNDDASIVHDDDDEMYIADDDTMGRFGTARGIARGFIGFGQGVFGAATGIVSQPLESGAEGGWAIQSVLKGVGKGLVGVVTKPIGGAADFVAQTSGGIMQEAGIGSASGPQITRKRKTLMSIPHPALRVNWKVLKGGESFIYNDHVLIQGEIVEPVITDRHLYFFTVFNGKGSHDISTIAFYKWNEIIRMNESFRSQTKLNIEIMDGLSKPRALFGKKFMNIYQSGDSQLSVEEEENEQQDASSHPDNTKRNVIEMAFNSKADRRAFVRIALSLQRRNNK